MFCLSSSYKGLVFFACYQQHVECVLQLLWDDQGLTMGAAMFTWVLWKKENIYEKGVITRSSIVGKQDPKLWKEVLKFFLPNRKFRCKTPNSRNTEK